MEKQIAAAIICLGFTLLGFLMFSDAVQGMRRGEYKYRSSWFHKGEDGIGFWIVTGSVALVSLFVCVSSLWFWLTRFILK